MFIETFKRHKESDSGRSRIHAFGIFFSVNPFFQAGRRYHFLQNRIFKPPKTFSWNRKKKNTGANWMNWLKAESLFRAFTIIVTGGANGAHSATGASIMPTSWK
jgi:hypothetical protein